MTPKELKRLSRTDLLEMVLELSKENMKLRKEAEQLRKQLDDRILTIESCGSLADAVLQLNGIFQAAQSACDQYTQNIQYRSKHLEQHCQRLEQETKEKCDAMLNQAKQQAQAYVDDARQKAQEQNSAYSWLTELMDGGENR